MTNPGASPFLGSFEDDRSVEEDTEKLVLNDEGLDEIGKAEVALAGEGLAAPEGDAVDGHFVADAILVADGVGLREHAEVAVVDAKFAGEAELGEVDRDAGEVFEVEVEGELFLRRMQNRSRSDGSEGLLEAGFGLFEGGAIIRSGG